MTKQHFYGWYDDTTQDGPTYDPPHDAPCPFCGAPISAEDVRTHSLMHTGAYAARSYFYRTHRTCADADKTDVGMDGFIFGMIDRNGD